MAIQEKRVKPVVRHTNYRPDLNKFKSVVNHFVQHSMLPRFQKMQEKGKSGWDVIDTDNLLLMRRKLAHKIKEGMLERKDLEVDIANYAVIVWFLRLEEAQREEVLREWGM